MGEKIKDLSAFEIDKNLFKIELNNAWNKLYSKYDIHIQSDFLQLQFSDSDFIKFAAAVKLSSKIFEENGGMKK